MKKAVIFYPHIGEYGGIETTILALATEIHRMGLTPVLICFYDHIGMSTYNKVLETVILGEHWNPFVKSWLLREWFSKNQDQIAGIPLFFGAKAGFYGAILPVSPFALHYTDPPSLLSKRLPEPGIKTIALAPRRYVSNWLMQRGVHKANICFTMTQWNADELKQLYGRFFKVVYMGGVPPTISLNNSPRCNDTTLRLFSISRITASKNLDWIISVAHHLSITNPFNRWFKNIEVVIAGKGPQLDDLQEQSKRLGIDQWVHFPGFLTATQVEDEYQKADLVLVPGRQGFGLPVLEALYRKVPVILNRESRISEMLESNPWVAISDSSIDSFTKAVSNHIIQLRQHYPDAVALNSLPTEQGWAFQTGQDCSWW